MTKLLFVVFSLFLSHLHARQDSVRLVVLGTIQDGGSPHIGCRKSCCKKLLETPDPTRKVVSLGLIDYTARQKFLLEATPDIGAQLEKLASVALDTAIIPNGIFLTHAHIGHYSGLMYLGREALNSKQVPVYCMPRMLQFLATNGPWSQLKQLNNIALQPLKEDSAVALTPAVQVVPILVPHRDEYSETVGFKIIGPNKTALFIPDINKWSIWKKDIIGLLREVDYLLCDATFYDGAELPNRKMAEIPHPFIVESMALFSSLTLEERNKVYFIHFNHTNPCLNPDSDASKKIRQAGFHIAQYGMMFDL